MLLSMSSRRPQQWLFDGSHGASDWGIWKASHTMNYSGIYLPRAHLGHCSAQICLLERVSDLLLHISVLLQFSLANTSFISILLLTTLAYLFRGAGQSDAPIFLSVQC